jgi:serine/threonine-protein kinase
MGSVFAARHLRLGRSVAVKFLPPELATRPEFRARFEREAHALALLSHPNIVTVHDFGEEDGQGYIVMERVHGRPLSAALPMSPREALEVGLQVCDALGYAHAQGIVHRDIKPQNILLDSAGRVKVTDFGLARMVGEEGRGWTLTRADEALGTLYYLAPEVLKGATPNPRMDIYSLGVVLYQCVTGALPVGHFEPLPGPLDRIVRRALAQDPDKRYATAEELARDLRSARAQVGERPEELAPPERWWMRAMALLFTTATAVAGWALLVSLTPRKLRPTEANELTLVVLRPLEDGQLLSLARFEVWPTLGALAAFAVAGGAFGLLRVHWARTGLDRPDPDRRLLESRRLLQLGLASLALYVGRHLARRAGLTNLAAYIPLLGALCELFGLYLLWSGVLEAWRRSRPLDREPLLLVGLSLLLLPVSLELLAQVWPLLR